MTGPRDGAGGQHLPKPDFVDPHGGGMQDLGPSEAYEPFLPGLDPARQPLDSPDRPTPGQGQQDPPSGRPTDAPKKDPPGQPDKPQLPPKDIGSFVDAQNIDYLVELGVTLNPLIAAMRPDPVSKPAEDVEGLLPGLEGKDEALFEPVAKAESAPATAQKSATSPLPDLPLPAAEEAHWLDFFDRIGVKPNPWFVGAVIAAVLLMVGTLVIATNRPAADAPGVAASIPARTGAPTAPPFQTIARPRTVAIVNGGLFGFGGQPSGCQATIVGKWAVQEWVNLGPPPGAVAVVNFTGPGLPSQETLTIAPNGTFEVQHPVTGPGTWRAELVSIAGVPVAVANDGHPVANTVFTAFMGSPC